MNELEQIARRLGALALDALPAALALAAPFVVVALTLAVLRGRIGRWLGFEGQQGVEYAWTIALLISMTNAFGLG